MILKYSFMTTKSTFLLQPLVTKFPDETAVLETSNVKDKISSSSDSNIVKFLAGLQFSRNSLNLECLNEISLAEVKADLKSLVTSTDALY